MTHRKSLDIRIYTNGNIFVETHNIKGKQCMKYMDLLAELMQAEVADSEFTDEYYETEQMDEIIMEEKVNI